MENGFVELLETSITRGNESEGDDKRQAELS